MGSTRNAKDFKLYGEVGMNKIKNLWSKLKEYKELIFTSEEKESGNYNSLELSPVKAFLEDFIGVIITGFSSFNDEIKDLEKYVQAKMVTNVEIKDKDIWIGLSKIDGTPGGYLKISPTIFGQFAETNIKEQPLIDSLYHIAFYGGVVLEYTDFKGKGMISYHPHFVDGRK